MANANNLLTVSGQHFGLSSIVIPEAVLDETNSLKYISTIYDEFKKNQKQINELKSIFVGNQAILNRVVKNTSVNEKININILPAIITTVAGLFLGEKIDYVYNGDKDESKSTDTILLNRHLRFNGDILLDKNSLIELLICGVAYQYTGGQKEKNEPLLLANLDTAYTGVVRSNGVGNKVTLSFIVGENKDGNLEITCFNNDKKFIIVQDSKTANTANKGWAFKDKIIRHHLPKNPIQEIVYNPYRLSLVAQLEAAQNAFNLSVSDSINSTIQQIRAMLVVLGAELTNEDAENARQTGILNATSATGQQITASFLTKPLDESIVSLRQFLFDIALFIAGMPLTGGGTSGNKGAAMFANGFFTANQNAYFNELEFKKPKQNLIANVITVLRQEKIITSELSSFDIDIRFDRNKMTDLVSNANALSVLLGANVPTKDALKVVGIFSDVEKVAEEMEQKVIAAVADGLVSNPQTNSEVKANATT